MQDTKVPVYSICEFELAKPCQKRRRWRIYLALIAVWSLGMGYLTKMCWDAAPLDDVSQIAPENPELIWSQVCLSVLYVAHGNDVLNIFLQLEAQEPGDLTWSKCYRGYFECARLKVTSLGFRLCDDNLPV